MQKQWKTMKNNEKTMEIKSSFAIWGQQIECFMKTQFFQVH